MKTDNSSIFEVLSLNSTSFYIPPFQRSYAWGETMIERFFSDIIRIIQSELNSKEYDKQEHFFGTIVLKNEEHGFAMRQVIVDGQQRLTTTLLFLIALRDSVEDEEKKKSIYQTFLTNQSSDFPDKIKLKQVTKDWEAYRALVNQLEPLEGTVTRAYKLFSKLIRDRERTNPEIKFEHYITALRRLNVAVIHLDERKFKGEDPQIIFETLNSLGKPLTLSDLIRNYVLLRLNSDQQSHIYENVWYPKIEAVLGDDLSDFFRDYLQYKTTRWQKVVSEGNTKELYQIFKDFVEESFESHSEFISDITKYVPIYKWILSDNLSPISPNFEKDREIKELLRNIFSDIKADAFKGLVMGLLDAHQNGIVSEERMSDEVLIDALTANRTYIIRRRIIKEGNGENKNIITIAKRIPDISNGSIRMIDLLSNMFYRMRLPNDDEVENKLKDSDFYKEFRSYAKFILGKIEEHNTKVSVDIRKPEITIEHLMPQKIDTKWEKYLGEDFQRIHSSYLHNIGNLILTEFNSELGNRSFEYKKEKLKESNLNYRLFVLNEEHWGEDSIVRHRDQMIKWFLETFSIPDDKKHGQNWDTEVIEDPVFSPIDEDAGENAFTNKPISVSLFGETLPAKTWQTVYIYFFNRLKRNGKYDWSIIENSQQELLGRENAIVDWKRLKQEVEENDFDKFKTLTGKRWDKDPLLEDSTLFVHTNLSATAMMVRMARVMKKLYIQRDDVLIRLR